MLYTGVPVHDGPSAVRYPRGAGIGAEVIRDFTAIPLGKGEVRRQGKRVAILAFGTMLAPGARRRRGARCHGGQHALRQAARYANCSPNSRASHDAFVTVEEHVVMGGAGSAVAEALAADGIARPVLQLGLPDRFIDHGEQAQLLRHEGLDAAGIESSIRARFEGLLAGGAGPRLVAGGAGDRAA